VTPPDPADATGATTAATTMAISASILRISSSFPARGPAHRNGRRKTVPMRYATASSRLLSLGDRD
jgi:hypothetical protein